MHQPAVLNLFLSWSDPQVLGWGERSRALQTLFLSKDGESCFPKTLLQCTCNYHIKPLSSSVALPMLNTPYSTFCIFRKQKKIQKFDTQENISLCQALSQCQ